MLLGFLVFALAFVAVLTLVVRLARLRVRSNLDYLRMARAHGSVCRPGPCRVVVS